MCSAGSPITLVALWGALAISRRVSLASRFFVSSPKNSPPCQGREFYYAKSRTNLGERREVKGDEARKQKITPWPKIRRTIYSLSAVAAIVGILVMTIPASTWQDTFNQLSRWGYKQYAQYFRKTQPIQKVEQYDTQTLMAMVEKSAKEISNSYYEQEILGHENPLHEVVWQILRGDYAVAQMILDEQPENLDPDHATYQDTLEDIQYLQALCELGLNHMEKAKKALQEIANSPSKHSQQAAELLKTAW